MSKAFPMPGQEADGGKAGGFKIGPRQNQLLAALPNWAYERLLPHLESSPLPSGAIVCDAGARVRHGYFPTTAIISLQQVLTNEVTSEVAVIGRDGMFGITLLTGGDVSSHRASVHCAGMGFRLKSSVLKAEFDEPGPLRNLLLRYAQVRIAQIAQTAVCYRHHTVDQQVCRRLLMDLDRLISSEIPVTHELMAATLGVRREAVTLATGRLQADGLIACSRGRIQVLERRQLEARACECYRALNKEVARVLPVGLAQIQVA